MLYRETIVLCSALRTKHTKTRCGQNVGCLNFKPGGVHSNHQALNCYLNQRPAPHPSGCPIIVRTSYGFSYRLVVLTAPANRFAIPLLTYTNQERVHRLCNIANSSTNFSWSLLWITVTGWADRLHDRFLQVWGAEQLGCRQHRRCIIPQAVNTV